MKNSFATKLLNFVLLIIFIEVHAESASNRKCRLGTRIPHPYDCGKYMVCGKTRVEYKCKSPMLYNHEIKNCDKANNVICTRFSMNEIQQNKKKSHSFGRSIFRSADFLNLNTIRCEPGLIIPHPIACNLFIKCGLTDLDNLILKCASPNLFNYNTLRCDLPFNVFCKMFNYQPRPVRDDYTTRPTITESIFCRPNCFFPHPTDCSKFVLCGKTEDQNKIYECPDSLLYNPYIQTCDQPQNVVCQFYDYKFITYLNQTTTTITTSSVTVETSTTPDQLNSTSSIFINYTTSSENPASSFTTVNISTNLITNTTIEPTVIITNLSTVAPVNFTNFTTSVTTTATLTSIKFTPSYTTNNVTNITELVYNSTTTTPYFTITSTLAYSNFTNTSYTINPTNLTTTPQNTIENFFNSTIASSITGNITILENSTPTFGPINNSTTFINLDTFNGTLVFTNNGSLILIEP